MLILNKQADSSIGLIHEFGYDQCWLDHFIGLEYIAWGFMHNRIYLASQSPRRKELLQQLGISCQVLPPHIDENPLAGEAVETYVKRMAKEKAALCLRRITEESLARLPVLAADTTVCLDGIILGKPEHAEASFAMLKSLSGRWHEVHTAVAVATAAGTETVLSTTHVEMTAISDADILAYVASGEPYDKAGAYGIQGLAGIFIKRIEGSYSGVMGLPVFETAQLLRSAGIELLKNG
jgi:septum formation protein